MKRKRILWLIAGIFMLLYIISINTENIKYVFLGVTFLSLGILFRISNIEHPWSPETKRIFAKGAMAWIAFIIIGVYYIFHCSYLIATTGIW